MSCIVGTNLKILINMYSLLQIHSYNCNEEPNQDTKKKTYMRKEVADVEFGKYIE